MTAKTTKTQEPAAVVHGDTAATTAGPPTKATRPAGTGKSGKTPTKVAKPRRKPPPADTKAKAERKARTDTKQAKLIAMLQVKDGATVEEIAGAFGWQAHTVRGALYGALKKKLGLDIVSEKVEGRGRVYRIGS